MREGARQLGSVEIDDLRNGSVELEDVMKTLAPYFLDTFQSILDVISIQEMKQRAKQQRQANTTSASSAPAKRTAEDQPSDNPSKRTRAASQSSSPTSQPKTPDQPTHPKNPDWSGGTEESKDEENTKALLNETLTDSMSVLESNFRRLTWQRSGRKVELFHTYEPF